MKTMLKVTLVCALFAVVNTVFASGNLKVNILPLSEEKALVAISSLTSSNLMITLKEQSGRIVYYKEVTDPQGDYRKIFNFSDLEDGRYMLSVKSNYLTSECPFQIKSDVITVGKEKTTMEPFFGYKEGILTCTYLNFPKEDLTLNFYEENQIIYTKKISRDFSVCKALNLSKLDKGNYVAVLSTGGKDYSYEIEK